MSVDYEKTALALVGDVTGKTVDSRIIMASTAAAQVFAILQLAKEVRELRELLRAKP